MTEHSQAPEHSVVAHEQGPGRRTVVTAGALTGVGAAVGWTAPANALSVDARAGAATGRDDEAVLRSAALKVRVDRAFPRVIGYQERESGAELHGQQVPVRSLRVNGKRYVPEVTAIPGADQVDYTLALPGGAELDIRIQVRDSTVHWQCTRIADTARLRVGTLEIPGLAWLAVSSKQPGAALLAARVDLDKDANGDTLVEVGKDTRVDEDAVGCAYAVLWTHKLAAAIETNTSYDRPRDGLAWENGRLWRQTVKQDGHHIARLGCGQWTHRADTASTDDTEPLPWVKVILTRDRNGDDTVDWQDAAIAMREIMVDPLGAGEQHLRVVPHIPFNFASQATNPFLATLDEIKRISLATDGLRQYTLLKGYQSEGHDSAHPDYGGNYNERAGGLKDLNTLLRAGAKWQSDFAVHVNATEAYPVANAFSGKLVDVDDEQWDWLDQSYRIDQRRDLVSGDVARRFRRLREETDPALNTLYIDVFRESGWTSDRLQRELREQGWQVTTEWGHGLERSSLWSHWATETDYGADTSRGINSQLIRFLRNHQKDVFADKWPTLLGIPRTGNYEGWRAKTDWHDFYELIWTASLPAKYLQAQPIRSWTKHEVTFEGEPRTSVSDEDGTRRITTDGRLVYDDGRYLLPWEPRNAANPDRLYHYNPGGGRTSWQLPRGWADADTVTCYRLTDQGRGKAVSVRVHSGGRVRLEAEAGQPYVLYREPAGKSPDPRWGEATPLVNPGFHAGDLTGWKVEGEAVVRLSKTGDHELVFPGGRRSSVRQRLQRLEPGDYVAFVQVQVGDKATTRRRAELCVRTGDGVKASQHTDSSTAANYVAADRKQGTRFQRMCAPFTVPEGGGPITLELRAGEGDGTVRFDGVRIVPDRPRSRPGWGPFVKGDAGGVTDPRTHVAQRNGRYTQRGWNGKVIDDVIDGRESLKSRGESPGLVYRTVPHTVRFRPGHRYRVSFRYENAKAEQYAWVTAVDEPGGGSDDGVRELERTPLPVATEPTTHRYEFTVPEEGVTWVGLRKTGEDEKAECVIDGFDVTPLD